MKKLLFMATATMAITSMLTAFTFGSKTLLATTKPVDSTLNGLDSTTFAKQHLDFLRYKLRGGDTSLLKTSFWFPRAVFDDMYNLLTTEIAIERTTIKTDTVGITDGIRVYVIYDRNQTGSQTEYKIALVSTKNAGSQTVNGKLYTWHQDYFQHNFNDDLFKLSNTVRQGVELHDDATGELLYKTCPNCTDDPNCDYSILHVQRRKDAEQMVQGYKSHAINTSAAWFDLNLFKLLHDDKSHTGVRIYFATYPNNYKKKEYQNRDTFVFTTTSKNATGKYDQDDFTCDKRAHGGLREINIFFMNLPALNTGELCPDNCD